MLLAAAPLPAARAWAVCARAVPRMSGQLSTTDPFLDEVARWLDTEQIHWTDYSSSTEVAEHTDRPVLLVGCGPANPMVALHVLRTPRSSSEVLPLDATARFADAWEEHQRGTSNDPGSFSPGKTHALSRKPLPLVHLWEDEWHSQSNIVRSRLLAMTGRCRRHFARKLQVTCMGVGVARFIAADCPPNIQVRRIDAATLDEFLLQNHLWGPTQAAAHSYRQGSPMCPTAMSHNMVGSFPVRPL